MVRLGRSDGFFLFITLSQPSPLGRGLSSFVTLTLYFGPGPLPSSLALSRQGRGDKRAGAKTPLPSRERKGPTQWEGEGWKKSPQGVSRENGGKVRGGKSPASRAGDGFIRRQSLPLSFRRPLQLRRLFPRRHPSCRRPSRPQPLRHRRSRHQRRSRAH